MDEVCQSQLSKSEHDILYYFIMIMQHGIKVAKVTFNFSIKILSPNIFHLAASSARAICGNARRELKGLTLFSELSITIPVLLAPHHAPWIHRLEFEPL